MTLYEDVTILRTFITLTEGAMVLTVWYSTFTQKLSKAGTRLFWLFRPGNRIPKYETSPFEFVSSFDIQISLVRRVPVGIDLIKKLI
jgi:hypothetical protein